MLGVWRSPFAYGDGNGLRKLHVKRVQAKDGGAMASSAGEKARRDDVGRLRATAQRIRRDANVAWDGNPKW